MNIYKAQELARLESHIDHETGEINIAAFESSQIALLDKQRAYVAVIKNRDAELSMLNEAIAELQSRAKAIASQSESLKSALLESMKQSGITEIKAENSTFRAVLYLDRDKQVVIDDDVVFPPALCLDPKPPAPSKAKIKAAIEAGEPVLGARIILKDRLEIK
jgi:hypothetical protein